MEVKNVQGYWNSDQSKSHHLMNGQIIIQDDGWFEGVMKIVFTNNKNDIGLVFGVYHLNKVFDFFYCSDKDEYIYHFHCDCRNKNHNGKVSVLEPFILKDFDKGKCTLVVKNNHISTEKEVQSKINIMKYSINYNFLEFYQRLVSHKEEFIKTVLKCYWNSSYQIIDMQKFLELCESQSDTYKVVALGYTKYLQKKYDYKKIELDLNRIK